MSVQLFLKQQLVSVEFDTSLPIAPSHSAKIRKSCVYSVSVVNYWLIDHLSPLHYLVVAACMRGPFCIAYTSSFAFSFLLFVATGATRLLW